jgi:DNA gyrase inhibitor GyrI
MSLGIKRTRPMRVAMKTIEGTPAELAREFENLFAWTRRRGIRVAEPDSSGRMGMAWTAVLHDEAATTADGTRRMDLWIPLDGAGASQPGYTIKDITHENVAFMIHKGAMSRLDETVQQLFTWAGTKQLPFRHRVHRRIFLRGIDGPREDPDWEAEVQIPLLPMRSS